MEKTPLKIADSIAALLKGDATEEQRLLVKSWLEQSDANLQTLRHACDELASRDVDALFDSEKSWDAIVRKIEIPAPPVSDTKQLKVRMLMPTLLKYAAVVAIPLMLGVLVAHYFEKPAKQPIEFLAEFTKDYSTGKIVVVNADGSSVAIDSSMVGSKVGGGTLTSVSTIAYSDKAGGNAEELNRIVVPRGKSFTIKLSDGTTVNLNSESELVFPTKFSRNARTVAFKGEGYFNVEHNKRAPFSVKTPSYTVKVLGTTFNIRAYADDPRVITTLCSGRIQVEGLRNSAQNVIMEPGQQLEEDRSNGCIVTRIVDVQQHTSWTNNRFRFDNTPIDEVIKTLERAYSVNFVYDESEFTNEYYSGSINRYGNIDECLTILEYGSSLKASRNRTTIYLKKKR